MKKTSSHDSDKFMALSESDRQRMVARLERESPRRRLARSRPLNAADRKRWKRFQQKLGRPRVGRGSKAISLTLEKGLLQQVDSFAKRHGLSRSQLVARSLRATMERAA